MCLVCGVKELLIISLCVYAMKPLTAALAAVVTLCQRHETCSAIETVATFVNVMNTPRVVLQRLLSRFVNVMEPSCNATVPTVPTDGATAGGGKKSKIVYGKRKPANRSKQAAPAPAPPAEDKPPTPPAPPASDTKAEEEKNRKEEEEEEEKVKAAAAAAEEEAGADAADDWEDAVDDWDSADVTVRQTDDKMGFDGITVPLPYQGGGVLLLVCKVQSRACRRR